MLKQDFVRLNSKEAEDEAIQIPLSGTGAAKAMENQELLVRPEEGSELLKLVLDVENFGKQIFQGQKGVYSWIDEKSPSRCVIASVVIRQGDGDFKFARGRNLEVSKPDGFMCAERSAVANVASQFPCCAFHSINSVRYVNTKKKIVPGSIHSTSSCGLCAVHR